MRDQPETLTALRQIARSLSAAWDLDTTLDLIARKTTEVMRVNSCTIYLLDPDGKTLRMRASTGLAPNALGRGTLRVGEGLTGQAVATNAPVYAAQAQADPRFKWVARTREDEYQSLLAVPLVTAENLETDNRPIGALNVQTFDAHDYTSAEIDMLSLIADIAAGALAKAQLYDNQHSQLAELQALAKISEAVISPQYLDDILDVVTQMAAKAMSAAVCSLFLLDENGEQLALHAAARISSPYHHREPQPYDEGVLGAVVTSGTLQYVPDVAAEPLFTHPERAKAEGLASMLAVPLSVRDHVIGVLVCYSAEIAGFTDDQIILFSTLANQTALAIENARLITNAAVIREMHHRIKNNLQTVAMLMQIQLPEADQLDTAEVLVTNIHRIQSIATVHEVLSEKGFRLVDLRDVLLRIARATEQAVVRDEGSIKIDVVGERIQLPSKAATALALIVNELVQNALEHGFDSFSSGTITISLGRSPSEIIILVRDNGAGLPEPFARGMGLEIAETLVSGDLRGTLKFNRLAQGTEASIRLPRSVELDPER
ncbi:MAG: GAF domain-containing protein [Anaerolineae bacterium]|nr:GAF domain-containing protein [Anaerolineae bacterium]MCO5206565.1 GAF domain-containing protein [Anaerolineae bacterium]